MNIFFSGSRGSVRYSIYSGDPDGYFSIDPLTGTIRTASALDHEAHQSVLLNVQAMSGDPPAYGHTQVSGCESPTVSACQNTCICCHSAASKSGTIGENVSIFRVGLLSRPRIGRIKNCVSMLGKGKIFSFLSNRPHRFWGQTCLLNDCRDCFTKN